MKKDIKDIILVAAVVILWLIAVFWGVYFSYPRNEFINQNLEHYETPYSCKDCNVVMISIDTLRADHTGFMRYFRNTTPNLDKLAKESVVFENAFSQAPSTTPSHASIFTSLYPSQHGTFNNNYQVPSKFVTLAEIMKSNGYNTVAFVGDAAVSASFGFHRGFEIYNEHSLLFSETVPKAIKWIESNKKKRFFLFLHGYEPHEPYGNSEFSDLFTETIYSGQFTSDKEIFINEIESVSKNTDLSEDDINYIKAKYDGDIRQVDKFIGLLINKLKTLGLYDKTTFIIFSDHGERLGEIRPNSQKPIFGHYDLYDVVLHTVLIIRSPNLELSKRVQQVVSSIDISPTVLELAGIGKFKQFKGKSLLDAIFNETESFSISETLWLPGFDASVRTSGWKFIVRGNGILELYDLKNDNKELNNVIEKNPEVADGLFKILENTLIDTNKEPPEKAIVEGRILENLKRLGYIT